MIEGDPGIRKVADDPVLSAELLLLFRMILADGKVDDSEMKAFRRICRELLRHRGGQHRRRRRLPERLRLRDHRHPGGGAVPRPRPRPAQAACPAYGRDRQGRHRTRPARNPAAAAHAGAAGRVGARARQPEQRLIAAPRRGRRFRTEKRFPLSPGIASALLAEPPGDRPVEVGCCPDQRPRRRRAAARRTPPPSARARQSCHRPSPSRRRSARGPPSGRG